MTWRSVLFLAVLAGLILRLIGLLTIPLVDPSEGRYAASAAEILRSGDWLTPQVFVQGEAVPYLGKPPLQQWLSAAAMRFGGIHPFWLRVPNLLAFLLMLILMYAVLARYLDKTLAVTAVSICATTPAMLGIAGVCLPDGLLTAAVACAYLAYYAFLMETEDSAKRRWSVLVFIFAAVGMMIKGPVALIFICLPVLVWTFRWRRWDTLRQHAWLPGVSIFVAIAGPWFVLCEIENPGFLTYFFLHENFLRFLKPEYGDKYGQAHHQYFGAAIVFTLLLGLPWSIWGLSVAVSRKGRPFAMQLWRSETFSFFCYVVGANTLFWCFSRNYLATYLLPLMPAISVLAAMLFCAVSIPAKRVGIMVTICAALIGSVSILLPFAVSDFSSLTVGRLALAEAERLGTPPKICWIRKIPHSAFFYFPTELVVPPHADALAEGLPWFLSNNQFMFISLEKHLYGLPPEIQQRAAILNRDGRWVVFKIR